MIESEPINQTWRTKKIERLKCTTTTTTSTISTTITAAASSTNTNEYQRDFYYYYRYYYDLLVRKKRTIWRSNEKDNHSNHLTEYTKFSSSLSSELLLQPSTSGYRNSSSRRIKFADNNNCRQHRNGLQTVRYNNNGYYCNNNNNNNNRFRRLSLALFVSIFIMCCSLIVPSTSAAANHMPAAKKKSGICPSLDIRNSVESFRQLTDCRVIEGFLQIVLMDRTNESHFANLTFPKLQEITGYLLLYRINGLRSLSKLFPNLSVIRGHNLFINYALAVYEMLHLQELGLYSLIDIPRGAVFITKNPLLCYIDTIDWNRIVTSGKDLNLISENRQSNACPKCPAFNDPYCAVSTVGKQSLCWTNAYCQKACPNCPHNRCTSAGECCHDYCLGGCNGASPDKCFACKNVFLEDAGHCVTECPYDYFKFRNYRCIKSDDCYDMPKPRGEVLAPQTRNTFWKPFNGTCIYECPPGYEETQFNDGVRKKYKCEPCKGACRKVCDPANVDSIQSAQRLKGCVVINGSLEIQIRGGSNIVKELEDNLNMIEEITGYLKVVRSISLVSLNFLRRLREIHGVNLESGKYALIVLDNQNLAELWDFKRKEQGLIIRGRIFFHFNPKLCLDKIHELQNIIKLPYVDSLDVARNSNGDKVACNISELRVSVSRVSHSNCVLTWVPYSHYEMRTLLGYVIYVMEAPHMNISMNDGRDACGGDSWKVYDVEVPDLSNNSTNENMTQIIPHLKPYTLYAYYIKTYTIASETNGAQSKIQYFRTKPSTPTPPRQLKVTPISSNSILIEWQPPESANGNLTKYNISVDITKLDDVQRNYCTEPIDKEKTEPPPMKEETKKKTTLLEKKNEDCPCSGTEGQTKIKKNDQEVQALIEFENKLQDSIYVKNSTTIRQTRDTSSQSFKRQIGLNSPIFTQQLHFSSADNDVRRQSSEGTTVSSSSDKLKINAFPPTPPLLPPNQLPAQPPPPIVNNEEKQTTSVPSNQHNFTVNHLKHFSEYTINIQACRELIDGEPANYYAACSQDKVATVQTHPLEEADKIDQRTIKYEFMNNTSDGTVKLRWAEPNITNGKILTYQIRYQRVDIDHQHAITACITPQQFRADGNMYVLRNLHPGNYSVILRATTLSKDPRMSQPIYFFIKETNPTMLHQVLLIAVSILVVVVLIVIVMLITSRYFYRDKWDYPNNIPTWVNPEYFKAIEGYDQWEVPRRKVQLGSLLGIGHFGEVYEGRAKGIIQKGVTTRVAIKTLSKPPSNRTWSNFLNEATVMKQFDTHHVVHLLGVVTKGGPLVIMELMAKGDLRTYLRSCRTDIPEEERKLPAQTPPTLKEILQMAAEIADGMLYLSDKKFVHRDLAARNCLINEEGTVKIGDFGLTRDVYETDYYRKDSKGHLPVRWMAPESLRDGIFTSRSDVWSFGVVLWEMATLASLPYTGLGNGEVMPYVINGGTMDEPENCPPILAEIMKLCWQYKYTQRPTFSYLLEILMPNLKPEFEQVSYYHSESATQLRANNTTESNADEDDDNNSNGSSPYTPLRRKMEDIEDDFSLGDAADDDFNDDADDDDDDDDVNDVDDDVDVNDGNKNERQIKLPLKKIYNNNINTTNNNNNKISSNNDSDNNVDITNNRHRMIDEDDDEYEDNSNPNQLLLTDDDRKPTIIPTVTVSVTASSPSYVTVTDESNCCSSSSINRGNTASNGNNNVISGYATIINNTATPPPLMNGYIHHRLRRTSIPLNDLKTTFPS